MTSDATPLPHQGLRFYDREVWLLGPHGDSDEVSCVLIQGTDRRSYAALSRYLGPDRTSGHRSSTGPPRPRPTVTAGHVALNSVGDDVHVEFLAHSQPTRRDAVAVLIVDS